jgi:phosphonate transport system substrate-binding protein
MILMTTFFCACDGRPSSGKIDFSQTVEGDAHAADRDRNEELVFAVSTMFAPRENVKIYEPFVKYLAEILGTHICLRQRGTYREVNNLFEKGEADFGFVCTGAFLEGEARFGLQELLVPEVEGKTTYRSIFLVPRDSKARSLADLEGVVFGFTDPMSNTGCLYPTAYLAAEGKTPTKYFSEVKFLGSHQASIRAVFEGSVDAAAVDHLVFDHMTVKNPDLRSELRVIHESPPFGIPPLVVRPGLEERKGRILRKALLEMADTEQGRRILSDIGVERFVEPPAGLYDSARRILGPVLPSLNREGR